MNSCIPSGPSSCPDGTPFEVRADGVRVAIRVQPKASRAEICGVTAGAGGGAHLKVRVTAPPESGKANEAVIKLLAKSWGLKRSAFALLSGGKSRDKTIWIAGDGPRLIEALSVWLKATVD